MRKREEREREGEKVRRREKERASERYEDRWIKAGMKLKEKQFCGKLRSSENHHQKVLYDEQLSCFIYRLT